MAYTINLTDGTLFATIPDGTINTTSSMTLIGKNYAGYGDFLDTNFIHLLENSSGNTAPGAPLTGQLWWDKANSVLKVYNGTQFKTISGSTASSSAPTGNITGDLWFNTSNQILYVWTGSAWLAVGPSISGGTGVTVTTIVDNTPSAVAHPVIELVVGNAVVGIVSKDDTFTPAVPISGFTTVRPGITLATSISSIAQYFQGIATNAVTVTNAAQGNITSLGTLTSLTVSGNTTVTNIVNGNGNGVGNIGTSSNYFNTIFAKATSAQYADVAERFAADAEYQPGTVVELGGIAEITCSTNELSDTVFGVISTQAAYLMNSSAGTDSTHPPVAMTGRVPVRVTGVVRKGDRLVSAGNGIARSAKPGEATAFNVIGRALKDKLDSNEGIVEAIVATK